MKPKRIAVIEAMVALFASLPSVRSAAYDVPFDYERSTQLPRVYVFDADESIDDMAMNGVNLCTLTLEADVVFEWAETGGKTPHTVGNQLLAEIKHAVGRERTKLGGKPVLGGLALDVRLKSNTIQALATSNDRKLGAVVVSIDTEYHEQMVNPYVEA